MVVITLGVMLSMPLKESGPCPAHPPETSSNTYGTNNSILLSCESAKRLTSG